MCFKFKGPAPGASGQSVAGADTSASSFRRGSVQAVQVKPIVSPGPILNKALFHRWSYSYAGLNELDLKLLQVMMYNHKIFPVFRK